MGGFSKQFEVANTTVCSLYNLNLVKNFNKKFVMICFSVKFCRYIWLRIFQKENSKKVAVPHRQVVGTEIKLFFLCPQILSRLHRNLFSNTIETAYQFVL